MASGRFHSLGAVVLGLAAMAPAGEGPPPAQAADAEIVWPQPPSKPAEGAAVPKAEAVPAPSAPVRQAQGPEGTRGAVPAAAPLKGALPPEEVERLVAALGHDEWGEREKASARLQAGFVEALPALLKASKSASDPEIRSRAQALIDASKVSPELLERISPHAAALAGGDPAKRKEAAEAVAALGLAVQPILEGAARYSPEAAGALAGLISRTMTLSKEAVDGANHLRVRVNERAPKVGRKVRQKGAAPIPGVMITVEPSDPAGGRKATANLFVPDALGVVAGPGVFAVVSRRGVTAMDLPDAHRTRWQLKDAWPESETPDGAAIAAGALFLRFPGARLRRFDLATGAALDEKPPEGARPDGGAKPAVDP